MFKLKRDVLSYRTVVWWSLLAIYAMPALSSNIITNGTVWTTRQMDNFFPAWQDDLRSLLNDNCSKDLEYNRDRTPWRPYHTVQCLITNFPEFRKAEMAASSVLLGLLPVVLSQLGPSTIEQSLLHLRQPPLALLLAIGSPAVNGLQNVEYIDALKERLRAIGPRPTAAARSTNYRKLAIIAAEYIMALFAVANVAILAYQLSVWAITVFAMGFIGLPAIWIALAAVIHFVRIAAFYFKFEVDTKVPLRLRHMLVPGRLEREITLRERPSNDMLGKMGRILAWILYFGTSLHTLLGVVSLSGLVFISMADSVVISMRFLVNAIICKFIFAIEAAGIEEDIDFDDKDK